MNTKNLDPELDRHLENLQEFIIQREKICVLIRAGYKNKEKDLMQWNVTIADYIDLLYKIMCEKKRCV